MFTGIWFTKAPHLLEDAAVSILIHDRGTDDYHVVNVLWQEDPLKYHVEGQLEILNYWPDDWVWTHIEDGY